MLSKHLSVKEWILFGKIWHCYLPQWCLIYFPVEVSSDFENVGRLIPFCNQTANYTSKNLQRRRIFRSMLAWILSTFFIKTRRCHLIYEPFILNLKWQNITSSELPDQSLELDEQYENVTVLERQKNAPSSDSQDFSLKIVWTVRIKHCGLSISWKKKIHVKNITTSTNGFRNPHVALTRICAHMKTYKEDKKFPSTHHIFPA